MITELKEWKETILQMFHIYVTLTSCVDIEQVVHRRHRAREDTKFTTEQNLCVEQPWEMKRFLSYTNSD